ncbi:hypothetical protein [Xanthobacter aminoxidans]|uniref:hypothetical protein n=1 Tax=Xanthobacter aminoxidans TaxID=186280 RepID=UPI002022BAEC|nr:hypothetical protein [Xanthobacter aminoxidans]MCL8385496.1 hypothetical protein [Xanthobacter aminoxidans]
MSGDFVHRLLFGRRITKDEFHGFLDLGRSLRNCEGLGDAAQCPLCAATDMGRELFRSVLLLEGKAFLKALRELRLRESERYLGFGNLPEEVHEDELERQHLAAQVNFQVLKRLVPAGHVIPPDLDGLTAEDWYVAYHVAEWSKRSAERDGPLHSQS